MPIPKPKPGEDKDTFTSRCMGSKPMQEYDQSQRYAICLDTWNRRGKTIDPETNSEITVDDESRSTE